MADSIIDAAIDAVKLLPFLFLTYLLLEWLEKRAAGGSVNLVRRSGAWGPIAGALIGIVPQCGFSASAANLFAQRLISAGTLIAVFLSTSDEMLPILLTSNIGFATIAKIIGVKVLTAIAVGLFADKVMKLCRHDDETVDLHGICERDHCHCEERGIVLSAILHTTQIFGFVLAINIVLNVIIYLVGEENLSSLMVGAPVLGTVLSAMVGLIPNCAASILITELYLTGALSTGAMLSGLLAASGVGLLVLFRVNRHAMRDNVKILLVLIASSVCVGLLVDMLNVTFYTGSF